jgi:5'-methylthioadenosine phosphorylase
MVGDEMTYIAIIGGTGVYDPNILANVRQDEIMTPYGLISYKVGDFEGRSIAFIPRHGSKHSIAPHLINYQANIWAMKKIGVKIILATAAVGSLNLDMKLGDFVLVDQFLDFTRNRKNTFYEGGRKGVVHVDLTSPYCSTLRANLLQVAQNIGISIHNYGTYVCTEGPRFETPAEINMFAKLGGHLVGMTNVPEVVLAREAEMCYATIAMVTNYAAGISPNPLTYGEVIKIMNANTDNLKKLLMKTINSIDLEGDCSCQHALAEYGGFKL